MQLEEFPQSGAYPKDRVSKSLGYRYLVHGDYLISYALSDESKQVNIVAFFNANKDYIRVLRNLI